MRLSIVARRQIQDLRAYYRRLDRHDAILTLTKAVSLAGRQITQGNYRPAPIPYPELEVEGQAWTHAGAYWFVFTTAEPIVVLGVFYDRADIPGRR